MGVIKLLKEVLKTVSSIPEERFKEEEGESHFQAMERPSRHDQIEEKQRK